MKIAVAILIGAFIGWITNYIAIKMLFRPHKEVNFLFFRIQGLIPKRRNAIAYGISETIEKELLSIKDVLEHLESDELDSKLEEFVDDILDKKLKETIISNFPMASIFLTEGVLEKIKKAIKDTILGNKTEIIQLFSTYIEEKVDFAKIVREKISDFSLDKLEEIIFNLAKNELKHIEVIGAILGGAIGLIQYFVLLYI